MEAGPDFLPLFDLAIEQHAEASVNRTLTWHNQIASGSPMLPHSVRGYSLTRPSLSGSWIAGGFCSGCDIIGSQQ